MSQQFAVEYDVATGKVLGTLRGEQLPTESSIPGAAIEIVDQSTYVSIAAMHSAYLKAAGAGFDEIARPTLSFTPALVEVGVGDPEPTIAVTALDDAAKPLLDDFDLAAPGVGTIAIRAGIASLTVDTSAALAVAVKDCPAFKVAAPLIVRVARVNRIGR